jgi:mono/diheme cytochrome c family protein
MTARMAIVIVLVAGSVAIGQQSASTVQPPTPAKSGDIENGKKLYVKVGCAACHGLEGQGAPTSGPRIGPNPLPLAAFVRYVRMPRNQMPPYTAKVMSDEDLGDVWAFLAARPKPSPVTVLSP